MIDVLWSKEKCATPRDCRKCLDVCPNGVLGTYGAGREPGKKETNWTVAPVYLALCDACGLCAQACPSAALQVRT
ncbi:MAG: 4Fe-4S dicluster domain-containing protein [Chloroflexota bacterium]